ncbi:hypothetical protein C1X05_12990 [Laceyella sacchari]|jgi:hypothetical protein|uniref:Uncharacterized protein n=2 Tax=Laceyella TaxID=292635 RepID=A0AA46AES7_9BACL|nr:MULTISPECIES: hypothetical protein [Laceyella]AUS09648.1 hypothetical protein C1X05_12990 [Laceyella sacchari]MRG28701.1 hypothetical protein [Laceyella tengchongensis]PRZ17346.1 hypothetical protein CLV36_101450 [Laceyella sediminis]TCW37881.1 hypothetical protein EDC32_103552 [Laceyella sacchari]SMP14443.1 hypothetical protein SAMN06265361_102581 [Laceyella tengchongensis]
MSPIILITGNVAFRINLDPSIWILDDRRFPLEDRIAGTEGLAMELGPYLDKAEPDASVTKVICHREQKEAVTLTLDQARTAILCFAKDGRPIREGGPALLYLADGSNKEQPIDYIRELELV